MLRRHFCAGVLVAPFPLTATVTGLLYAGSFQAERLVRGHEPTVPAGERELPASVQVAAARKGRPEGTVAAVRPAPEAGVTARVLLSGVEGGAHTDALRASLGRATPSVSTAAAVGDPVGALRLRTAPREPAREAGRRRRRPRHRPGHRRAAVRRPSGARQAHPLGHRPVHTGVLFGQADQIALALLALADVVAARPSPCSAGPCPVRHPAGLFPRRRHPPRRDRAPARAPHVRECQWREVAWNGG
ncbi:hypothetical protein GCM10010345_36150 [Streptomyces canarius]|uniref:Uncharacterized protein n=1 Tax=Streptomyces canarius TaxID=285453 RepID=A0ABQ3CN86_9ACTN|nr:hypothetical protein GCM10010345_36150 [Streptomyces canarius]